MVGGSGGQLGSELTAISSTWTDPKDLYISLPFLVKLSAQCLKLGDNITSSINLPIILWIN